MEDKSRITGLYLENFMSIRGPIYLDIEPITLLYGPNSAGKSAISSAIKLISKFRTIGGRRTFVLNEEFNSELYGRLYRHDISNDMKLGVRFKIYEFSGPLYEIDQNILNISEYAFSDTFEDLSDFLYQRETGGFFTFEIFFSASCNAESKSCHVCMDSIKEGGRPLIDANGCEGQVFYLDHPIMIAIDKQLKKFGTSFFKLLSAVYQNETHTVNNNKLETRFPLRLNQIH